MNVNERERFLLTVSCRDTDYIPKVADAGKVFTNERGERVQVMHNGVQVLADTYYGDFITHIVDGLKGHHEPQEEKVFFEILKTVGPGATMIELGAYWSYYSLWFQAAVKDGRSFMVEPMTENLRIGRRNFELNGRTGTFIQALVGAQDSKNTDPETISVDGLMKAHGLDQLDILHADTQGAEHAMLIGAARAIAERRVRYVIISTHGYRLHARCLGFLRKHKYNVLVEHTPAESFSLDGLIAATTELDFKPSWSISYRPVKLSKRFRSLLCRLQSYWVH
jgi:hypothetical protein